MDKKWNLQDIKPAADKTSKKTITTKKTYASEKPPRSIKTKSSGGKNQKMSNKVLIALICIGIIVGGLIINMFLNGAEVQVKPRSREVTINSEFSSYTEPKVGELGHEILTLEATGERQVKSVGQEPATEQATGNITIYKNTPESERLIKNTRFESPEGLIFRITESVVVPGATTDSEGNTVPGSITATAFADEAGEEYNLGKTKFTVPGFKEGGYESLYEAIYAENTSEFTGGFEGVRFILDENDLTQAQEDVREELRSALADRLQNEKPAGTISFDNSITYSYQSLPATESGEGSATISEKVYLYVPLFKESDFASFIAEATVPGYEDESVRIDNYENLDFSFTSTSTTTSTINDLNELKFDLAGKVNLIWTFDVEALKDDLVGKKRTAIVNILSAYPSIENTKITIRPFWKRSIPEDKKDIEIVENLELSPEN